MLKLSSPAFKNGETIPSEYTCEGKDVNPPLLFEYIPGNTKSLALVMDDPDAPAGTWVHWVIWNMAPDTREIEENSVPVDAEFGMTSSNTKTYGGPCPPSGIHRYFFKLYALDTRLNLPEGASKADLEQAMQRHIIEQAELVGIYQRGRLESKP